MEAILSIRPKKCLRLLVVMAFVLTITGIGGDIVNRTFDTGFVWPVARQFDFVEEGNFVNWYQSSTLLWCAVTLAAVAFATKKSGGKFAAHWAGLAAAFLFLSIDESAQIHDTTISNLMIQVRSHADGPQVEAPAQNSGESEDAPLLKARWMLVYLPVVALFGALYVHFLLRLPRRTSGLLIFAGCQYVGGVVAVELLADWYSGKYGDDDLLYSVIGNASELLEMLGVAWCSYAALDHLALLRSELRLTFSATDPVPRA